MFTHSPKARMLWREQTERSMVSYSPTRWWSRWEVYKQLLLQFGDIAPFLQNNEDIAPATRAKLLPYLLNDQKKIALQLELAAIVDFGEPFIKATYWLEGDGPLALEAFEIVHTVAAAVQIIHAPNLEAIAQVWSHSNVTVQQQLVDYGKCAQPAFHYFNQQLLSTLQRPLEPFKAARHFSPQKVHTMQPDSAAVDTLRAFSFLADAIIQ